MFEDAQQSKIYDKIKITDSERLINIFKVSTDNEGAYRLIGDKSSLLPLVGNSSSLQGSDKLCEILEPKLYDSFCEHLNTAFKGLAASFKIYLGEYVCQIQLTPTYLENGKIEIIGTNLSLENPKLEELERFKEYNDFRMIFDSAPFPFLISRCFDGLILDYNKSALDFFETEDDDIRFKMKASDFYKNPSERNEWYQKFDELIAKQSTIEVNVYTKKGALKIISFASKKIIYNNLECYLTAIYDITERKEAEKRIIEANKKNFALSKISSPLADDFALNEQIICAVLSSACGALDCKEAFILLHDESKGGFNHYSYNKNEISREFYRDDDAFLNNKLFIAQSKNSVPIIINKLQESLAINGIFINNIISAPLTKTNGIIGQISFFNSNREFDEPDANFIARISDYFSLAIRKSEYVEKLKISQANLLALINNNKDYIWAIDCNYRIIALNDNFKKFYKQNFKDDLEIGVDILNTGPETLNIWRSLYEKAFDGNRVIERQTYHIDGEDRYYEISLNPILSEGNIIGVTVFSRDVTEKKLQEDELNRKKEQMEIIMSNMAQGALLVDNDWKIMSINKQARELLSLEGKIDSEAYYFALKKWADSISNSKEIAEAIYESAKSNSNYSMEIQSINGRAVELFHRATPNGGFVETYSDITARKKAEDALKKSEEKYRFMTENIDEVIWQLDIELRFTYISPVVKKLYGYYQNELIGVSLLSLLPIATAEMVKSKMRQRLDFESKNIATSSAPYEIEIRAKSGKLIWSDIFVNPMHDSNRKLIGFHGITRDISLRKSAEQRLRKYADELKELNSSKDKFFSIIAHDLKNPLSSVMNAAALLAKPEIEFSREEILEYAADLHKSSKNLFNLLENLLDWARSQTGAIKFEPKNISLYELGQITFYVANIAASAKNIQIIVHIDEGLEAYGDFNMISATLRNLVSNAIKFSPEFSEICIGAEDIGESIKVFVKDKGVGISDSDLMKLFRIDVSHTTIGSGGEKGTGLGLILSKEFVEKNGGKIWVESKLGSGSKFIFTIPKKKV